jgi:predicted nucleic acid-binding protein
LFLSEDGSVRAGELWELDTPLVSSAITYAETSAAIAAARRERRLSRAGMTTALRALDGRWPVVVALDVDERTTRAAGGLAIRHRLRGMDSIHLASALTVAAARPLVVTWDGELRRAARAEGLAVSL